MVDYDASKISVSGAVLIGEATTGEKCSINVKGVPRNNTNDLTYACSGANTKPDVMMKHLETKDECIELYFVPLVPGEYKLAIRCKGRHISGSPFKVVAKGETIPIEKLLSKITFYGRAIELGKVNQINEFIVNCTDVSPIIGNLKVSMKSTEPRSAVSFNLIDQKNGTFKVTYKPTSPGMYKLVIKLGNDNIPGSPFSVRVTEFL